MVALISGDNAFSYGVITRGGWEVLNENALAADSTICACTKKMKWVGYIPDGNKKWLFTFTDHSCRQGTT